MGGGVDETDGILVFIGKSNGSNWAKTVLVDMGEVAVGAAFVPGSGARGTVEPALASKGWSSTPTPDPEVTFPMVQVKRLKRSAL